MIFILKQNKIFQMSNVYGLKDLVKITTLTDMSAILRTIKTCLGTPLLKMRYSWF